MNCYFGLSQTVILPPPPPTHVKKCTFTNTHDMKTEIGFITAIISFKKTFQN